MLECWKSNGRNITRQVIVPVNYKLGDRNGFDEGTFTGFACERIAV